MNDLIKFNIEQLKIVNESVITAEDLVSNSYKMSSSQWLSGKYDFKTLADLCPGEILDGPFAQIIRYEGQPPDHPLTSSSYDFYKICLQDHTILDTLDKSKNLRLFPFVLYIVTHELVHVVRFGKFLQSFEASDAERELEEIRVHSETHRILENLKIKGMASVFDYWKTALVKN